MSLSYAHKQTAIILVVCLLGVSIAGYVVYGSQLRQSTPENNAPDKDITVTQQTDTVLSTSTDWRNQFLAKGTSAPEIKRAATKTEPTEPETLSGQFGKKFFEQYMYLKQNNLSEDPAAIQALVNQTTENLVNAAPQPRVYDIRNVPVAMADDLAAERAYANTLGQILTQYMPKDDAAIVATQALEQNDQTLIRKIEVTSASYSTMLKKMLAVPTPSTLVKNQVNLINGVSAMVFVSEGMGKVFSDPIQGMVALALYEKSLTSLQNALLDLKYIFSKDQIQFTSTEPGIVFNIIN